MSDFIWKGRILKTMGETMQAIQDVRTPEEARAFLMAYEEITPHAKANIGYGLGYCSAAERDRLAALFDGCNHPVFGAGFGRGNNPTPREAFLAGVAAGRKAKRDGA